MLLRRVYFSGGHHSASVYVISSSGISINASKIEATYSWHVPTTFTTERSLHGLASFYRCFIRDFSSIMALITDYMQGNMFQWIPEANAIFSLIKKNLACAPLLVLSDFLVPLSLRVMLRRWVLGLF